MAKASIVQRLAVEAERTVMTRSRARIQGQALEVLVEVLAYNDKGKGAPITLAQVRKELRATFGVIVSDAAVVRTAQNKLGRTSWAIP